MSKFAILPPNKTQAHTYFSLRVHREIMNYILKILVLESIVIIGCCCGCSNYANSRQPLNMQKKSAQSEDPQTNHSNHMINVSDDEIVKLVDNFVGGESKALDEAEKKLISYPRQDLVERLIKIRLSLLAEDHRLISLAFVLCVLDHEYESNKHVLVSAFNREPHQQNLFADWEAWLINRLVRRGDKSLLPVLLDAIKWSDGGMRSALRGVVEEHLRDNTEMFLEALATMDENSRPGVYDLIDAQHFDVRELSKIRNQLSFVRSDSATNAVAKELLRHLNKRA